MGRVVSRLTLLESIALTGVVVLLVLTVIGSALAPYSPEESHFAQKLLPPSGTHWLGTDSNGMDIFSRILSAPRTDVFVAVVATALSVAFGTPLGVIVGFFEGRKRKMAAIGAETVLRLMDVIQAFPVFVLALALLAIRGPSVGNIIAAIAFVNAPVFLRLARTEVLSLRERPYAEAARVVGNSDMRTAFRHLLPNALAPIFMQISVTIGFSILLTAGLSFVGAGVRPPTPELGSMISTGSQYLITGQWWPSLFPGIALGVTVFVFATGGEALGRLGTAEGRASEVGAGVGVGARASAEEATSGLTEVLMTTPAALHAMSVSAVEDDEAESDAERKTDFDSSRAPKVLESPQEGNASKWSADESSVESVLGVSHLTVATHGAQGETRLLQDISIAVMAGETLGVVGETASGKSLLVRSLLQLLPEGVIVTRGAIHFEGRDLLSLRPSELKQLRGTKIAPILPDAKSQLNPVLSVGTFMEAVLRAHQRVKKTEARARAIEALKSVGIPDPELRLAAYPHELSGGMAQRVCIALALIHQPKLIIADEPTFGLDVTVQRQVLDLMVSLARERQAAQLIVTRDLGIVAHYCQRIAVMEKGHIVESGLTAEVFEAPQHPHTAKLLRSVRAARVRGGRLTGEVTAENG